MLEGLDEVPWDELHHAYGTAEDVPEILRSLVAGGASAEEAVHELFGNIWHQGSLYEATAHAVPFLIEIFDSPSPVRKDVGYLLRGIADGTSYHSVHRQRDQESEAERVANDASEAEQRSWVANAHAAVNSGLETYLRMLADRTLDQQVRVVAASVCGGCRERRTRALTGLVDVAAGEPPGDVRAGIVRAVDDLLDPDHPPVPAVVDVLVGAAHDARHPLTQGLAIAALLRTGHHRGVADVDLAGPLAAASVEMVRLPWDAHDAPDLFDRVGDAAPPALRLRAAAILGRSSETVHRQQGIWLASSVAERWRAPTPEAVRLLAPHVVDPDAEVRRTAAMWLHRFGDATVLAADAFAEAVRRYPDEVWALRALAKVRDPRAVPSLQAVFKGDDWERQGWLIEFIGPFAREVLPDLIRRVGMARRGTSVRDVGPWSTNLSIGRVASIGRFGQHAVDQGALEVLVDLLDRSMLLHRVAVGALGSLGSAAAPALGHVQSAADHWTGLSRAIAIEAVWRISADPARVMGALVELLDDAEARECVLPVIAEIGLPMADVLPRLQVLLAAPHPSMSAIEAAVAIDPERATGLISIVRDRWRPPKLEAEATFRMLERMGSGAAVVLDLLQADIESEERVADRYSAYVIEEDDAWLRACRRVVDRIAGPF